MAQFLISDPVILAGEVILILFLLFICRRWSAQKRANRQEKRRQEQTRKKEALRDSLKNELGDRKGEGMRR